MLVTIGRFLTHIVKEYGNHFVSTADDDDGSW
jgi:hypothetical protein